jgi:hypothetical protein
VRAVFLVTTPLRLRSFKTGELDNRAVYVYVRNNLFQIHKILV